jgi:hypothetical protein
MCARFARRAAQRLVEMSGNIAFAYQKFFATQPFFFQKDVAESVEARKVTPSFLTVERMSRNDVGHRSFEIQLPMTVGEPWPVASKGLF